MDAEFDRSLFEGIVDSAVVIDRTGRILDWNQGATTLFGYTRKEVLGRSINLVYQHTVPFPKIIQEILPKKKWTVETGYVRKNGLKGFCRTSAALLTPSAHNKMMVLVTHQNISLYKNTETELRENLDHVSAELGVSLKSLFAAQRLMVKNQQIIEQLEQKLRESELRFHVLAENATDFIARFTPDGRYLYVSPSSKALLGYYPEELTGCDAYRLLHHEDIPRLRKIVNRRKENTPYHTIRYRLRRKEGEYRWFESNVRIVRDEQTRVVREVQCASRDITDQILDKKARLRGQQLAHVFRLSTMEEMASGMAHEISQPLAAIVNYTKGCVRYLQTSNHDTSQLVEIMNKAVAQAERAGEVIQRLKNFFCKGQIFRSPCKINSLIRETVGLVRSDLNNSKTKIDFDLDRQVPIISADKIQVQQVMLNLIQNAIEAMHETDAKERRIKIQTRPLSADVEITIRDNGPGFSREVINRVFEPFFTTKAHGRGMGLAICRSIIEAHGGKFVINPNSGHQSWIRFNLPV